ncbi:Coenzyme F420 hydrogenase/dehydrogenase, beta subunit C-terminal domain [Rhodococcus sp. 5G237]
MDLSEDGFLRPFVVEEGADRRQVREEASTFRAVCPGIRLDAPKHGDEKSHAVFGAYISAWEGYASDPTIRYRGSSGGVLTALSAWLLTRDDINSVTASVSGTSDPKRTMPTRITESTSAISAAGSRYAPVSNLLAFDPYDANSVLVAKPCEVSAVSRLNRAVGISDDARPLRLSFFCAGTPSQTGTEKLVEFLGIPAPVVSEVRYRGQGWPGEFVAVGGGKRVSMSYDESWGRHIGRDIQWRCKLCVDGTGSDADISVGDYWLADESGYPKFDDDDGNSVVIARSARGHQILMEAAEDGIIVLSRVNLDDVAKIQPLQVERKFFLLGRLMGRLLSGKRIPRYYGYELLRLSLRNPVGTLRAIVGTARRSIALGSIGQRP